MTRVWPSTLAEYWQHYVPPCRPSRFDLDLSSSLLEDIRRGKDRRPSVLVLGSTNEFRDWAFEERCRLTVVDNSREFHEEISKDRRHKGGTETFVQSDWLDLQYRDEFDLVLGDLVVGNVWSTELPRFLSMVYNALARGGAFQTKSFFFDQESETLDFSRMVQEFHEKCGSKDPFPYFAYSLTVHCRHPDTGVLSFADMYDAIASEVAAKRLPSWVQDRYSNLGWGDGSKILFEVINQVEWEQMISQRFDETSKTTGPYSWSPDFPIYTCVKRPTT